VALLTSLPLETARALARAYAVELTSLEPLALGSVNSNFRARTADGRVLFARLYEEQGAAGAAAELALLAALARAGVPVADALPHTGPAPTHADKPFVLFPWIAGESLCLQRVDESACRKLGAALARVHLTSAAVPRLGPGRFAPTDMLERLDRVERATSRPELLADVVRARALYAQLVPARDGRLPSGIVHGDLFRDNVLWQAGELSALLDFESAFHGPFIYDLLVTLCAWCFRSQFELELARALVAGYEALRPLTSDERAAVPVEGALACLRFVSSRLTDFELRAPAGTPPVRDYRRFFQRLEAIEAGVFGDLLGRGT
jgi:homoserine kinase type II